jgi:protein-tyrosine-phosphatase/DNA-binding transcriptional ArsR family regulator
MNLDERSRIHAALGDRQRLAMVDALLLGDRTFQELAAEAGVPGNLAAHHLGVLQTAAIIERRVSEGDHRRRYIRLRYERLAELALTPPPMPGFVLFVCTHNSARSQFAAARWQQRTGAAADSAGTEPADRVHPTAVATARAFGLDLRGAVPKRYEAIERTPDLVISVCDRAHEAGLPFEVPSAHWSIPDPVRAADPAAFCRAFASIAERIDRLAPSSC